MALDRTIFDYYLDDMASNFYGGRKLQDKQADFLYKELRQWSQEEFVSAAKTILSRETYFPKLSTWYAARTANRASSFGPRKPGYIKRDCNWCDGYGWFYGISIESDGTLYETAYRGRCPHSSDISETVAMAPSGQRFTWNTLGYRSFPAVETNQTEEEVPF